MKIKKLQGSHPPRVCLRFLGATCSHWATARVLVRLEWVSGQLSIGEINLIDDFTVSISSRIMRRSRFSVRIAMCFPFTH